MRFWCGYDELVLGMGQLSSCCKAGVGPAGRLGTVQLALDMLNCYCCNCRMMLVINWVGGGGGGFFLEGLGRVGIFFSFFKSCVGLALRFGTFQFTLVMLYF